MNCDKEGLPLCLMDLNEFETIYEDKTIIILDTNILLALVKYSTYTSTNILKIFRKSIDKIWIPYQVFNEYIKNKNHEFDKSKKKYDRFKKDMLNLMKGTNQSYYKLIKESQKLEYPKCDILWENLQDYINGLKPIINDYFQNLGIEHELTNKEKQAIDLEAFVNELVNCNKIGSSITMTNILKIINEGELRYKYKIPPGYEDLKEKEGIDVFGDLFIWKELINYPKDNDVNNIIFITNDLKEDWWILSGEDKVPVKARQELVDEFKELNPNCEIFFLNLSAFHKLASEYFKIPSYYTYLELNADYYCRNKLYPKYLKLIWDDLYEYANQLDPVDFNDEFYKCNDVEVLGYELEYISSEFLIDDEYATYTILVNLPISMNLSYEDDEGDIYPMGGINLTVEAIIDISQEIILKDNKLKDDNGYTIVNYSENDIQTISPYDYFG